MEVSYILTGKTIKQYKQMCVYTWFRANGECLYVGDSGRGLGRAIYKHDAIGTKEEIKDDDIFGVYIFDNMVRRRMFEQELISKHKPKYNMTWQYVKKPKPLYGPARFKKQT